MPRKLIVEGDAPSELVISRYAGALGPITKLLALELPVIFWLLIWGARPRRANVRAS